MRDRDNGETETIRAAYLLIGSRNELHQITETGAYRTLGELLDNIDRRTAAQATETMAGHGAVQSAKDARETFMVQHMAPIAATAQLLELQYPDMKAIRMPDRYLKTPLLISHAIAMAEEASKRKDDFVALGLKSDFVERLHEGARRFREASSEPREHRVASHGATTGAEEDLKKAKKWLGVLDSFVKTAVPRDSALLAEWQMVTKFPPRKKATQAVPRIEAPPETLMLPATTPPEVMQIEASPEHAMLPASTTPIQATARIADETESAAEPRRWSFRNLLPRLR